jgi:hypothetical protein
MFSTVVLWIAVLLLFSGCKPFAGTISPIPSSAPETAVVPQEPESNKNGVLLETDIVNTVITEAQTETLPTASDEQTGTLLGVWESQGAVVGGQYIAESYAFRQDGTYTYFIRKERSQDVADQYGVSKIGVMGFVTGGYRVGDGVIEFYEVFVLNRTAFESPWFDETFGSGYDFETAMQSTIPDDLKIQERDFTRTFEAGNDDIIRIKPSEQSDFMDFCRVPPR